MSGSEPVFPVLQPSRLFRGENRENGTLAFLKSRQVVENGKEGGKTGPDNAALDKLTPVLAALQKSLDRLSSLEKNKTELLPATLRLQAKRTTGAETAKECSSDLKRTNAPDANGNILGLVFGRLEKSLRLALTAGGSFNPAIQGRIPDRVGETAVGRIPGGASGRGLAAPAPFGPFNFPSPAGAAFGGLKGGYPSLGPGELPVDKARQSLAEIKQSYAEMIDEILSGNKTAANSIQELFAALVERGRGASRNTGDLFAGLGGRIFEIMGDYAVKLGSLTGLASRAFAALRTLNPFAAGVASIALVALGQALRRLSSGGGTAEAFSSGGGSYGPALAAAGSAASGGAANGRNGAQVVNVYINGTRTGSPAEADRALSRAGVDRELRLRIRELARSGSNPLKSR